MAYNYNNFGNNQYNQGYPDGQNYQVNQRAQLQQGYQYQQNYEQQQNQGRQAQLPQPFRGLQNNGNTCYMNATLQALFNSPSARNTIFNLTQNERADDNNLAAQLQALFFRMQFGEDPSYPTRRLCLAFGMNELDMKEQRDAAEFLKRLLEKLGQVQDPKISSMFVGKQLSMIRCTNLSCCNNPTVQVVQFTDFLLPIKPDIFQSLAKMAQPDSIDNYQCKNCGEKVLVSSTTALKELPDLAVMTVSRFVMSPTGQMFKDQHPVNFPFTIDMQFIKHVHKESAGTNEKSVAIMFKVVMMPWLFFKVDGKGVQLRERKSAVEKQQYEEEKIIVERLFKNQLFQQHLQENYKNVEVKSPFGGKQVPPMQMVPIFPLGQKKPNNLYQLQAVSCHQGSMTAGHYFCIAFKGEDADRKAYNFNDSTVKLIQNPLDTLQFMIADTKQGTDQDGLGGGFTGYQYYYEKVSDNKDEFDVCQVTNALVAKEFEMKQQMLQIEIMVCTNRPIANKQLFPIPNLTLSGEIDYQIMKVSKNANIDSIMNSLLKDPLIKIKRTCAYFIDHQTKIFTPIPNTSTQLSAYEQKLKNQILFVELVPEDLSYIPFSTQKLYVRVFDIKFEVLRDKLSNYKNNKIITNNTVMSFGAEQLLQIDNPGNKPTFETVKQQIQANNFTFFTFDESDVLTQPRLRDRIAPFAPKLYIQVHNPAQPVQLPESVQFVVCRFFRQNQAEPLMKLQISSDIELGFVLGKIEQEMQASILVRRYRQDLKIIAPTQYVDATQWYRKKLFEICQGVFQLDFQLKAMLLKLQIPNFQDMEIQEFDNLDLVSQHILSTYKRQVAGYQVGATLLTFIDTTPMCEIQQMYGQQLIVCVFQEPRLVYYEDEIVQGHDGMNLSQICEKFNVGFSDVKIVVEMDGTSENITNADIVPSNFNVMKKNVTFHINVELVIKVEDENHKLITVKLTSKMTGQKLIEVLEISSDSLINGKLIKEMTTTELMNMAKYSTSQRYKITNNIPDVNPIKAVLQLPSQPMQPLIRTVYFEGQLVQHEGQKMSVILERFGVGFDDVQIATNSDGVDGILYDENIVPATYEPSKKNITFAIKIKLELKVIDDKLKETTVKLNSKMTGEMLIDLLEIPNDNMIDGSLIKHLAFTSLIAMARDKNSQPYKIVRLQKQVPAKIDDFAPKQTGEPESRSVMFDGEPVKFSEKSLQKILHENGWGFSDVRIEVEVDSQAKLPIYDESVVPECFEPSSKNVVFYITTNISIEFTDRNFKQTTIKLGRQTNGQYIVQQLGLANDDELNDRPIASYSATELVSLARDTVSQPYQITAKSQGAKQQNGVVVQQKPVQNQPITRQVYFDGVLVEHGDMSIGQILAASGWQFSDVSIEVVVDGQQFDILDEKIVPRSYEPNYPPHSSIIFKIKANLVLMLKDQQQNIYTAKLTRFMTGQELVQQLNLSPQDTMYGQPITQLRTDELIELARDTQSQPCSIVRKLGEIK